MQPQTDPDPLLADVERFLEQTGVTPTAFGQMALNDPTLVHEMRRGRECKRATRAKIRDFIVSETSRRSAEAA